jgi:hypothetical protein
MRVATNDNTPVTVDLRLDREKQELKMISEEEKGTQDDEEDFY